MLLLKKFVYNTAGLNASINSLKIITVRLKGRLKFLCVFISFPEQRGNCHLARNRMEEKTKPKGSGNMTNKMDEKMEYDKHYNPPLPSHTHTLTHISQRELRRGHTVYPPLFGHTFFSFRIPRYGKFKLKFSLKIILLSV